MLRRLSVALFAAMFAIWAGLATLTHPASADPVFPPGLRVGLEPPDGLTLSKQFPGFADVDRKVVLTILDLPVRAYEEIERSAFGNGQLDAVNMKREGFPFESGIGFLISGQVTTNGVVLHKWFLLASASGRDLAALVSVEVPDAARTTYTDAIIRKALASVTFRQPPLQEQLALVPFKLTELAGFRVMQASPAGGVILTDGATDDMNKQSYMIISLGPGAPNEPGERGKFAREMLSSSPLRELDVTVADPMRIGSLPGFEIRAQAKALDGTPVALVQWLRFGSGGFLRIIGVSRENDWDALFTRFRAVRDGIEMR
jgi:hypothetical protein